MRVLKWSRNFQKVNYDREGWHGAHWRHRWVEGQGDENLMKRREQPRPGGHSQNQTFIAFELLQVRAPLTTSITNHIKFRSGTSETRCSRCSSKSIVAQEVLPKEEFYASTWDRICPSSFWLEWCGSPGRGRRKERKLFRENEPKNGRRTLGIGTPKGIKGGGGGGSTIAQVTRESRRIPLIPICQ